MAILDITRTSSSNNTQDIPIIIDVNGIVHSVCSMIRLRFNIIPKKYTLNYT